MDPESVWYFTFGAVALLTLVVMPLAEWIYWKLKGREK